MYTPERENYEPTIITRTSVRGGGRTPIRHWEPAIKETIGTPNNNNKYLFYKTQSTPIRGHDNTSLTPLIERHSIRDVNPFYQASESEIAETPGMIETPNSSFTSYDEAPSTMFTIQSKLDDEMRRLEQLHEDLLAIKEQCAFLTNSSGSSTKIPTSQRDLETTAKTPLREVSSWRTRTPIGERRSFTTGSQPHKIQKTMHTPLKTPYKEQKTTTPISSSFSFNHHSNNYNTEEEEKKTPKPTSSSIRNAIRTTPSKTPYQSSNNSNNNHNNKQKSPGTELNTPDNSTQEFLNEISSAKLKSTEIIRTPGGSRVANKFWKEIHGKNTHPSTLSPLRYPKSPTRIITTSSLSSSSLISSPSATISKKKATPTLTVATTTTPPPPPPPPPPQPTSLKRKKTWKDGEEEFWSESSPKPTNSTFNNRLFKAAREEKITRSLEEELQSAARKEQLKPLPLPAVNPDMIAELKARHRERFLDDSDSYKFA